MPSSLGKIRARPSEHRTKPTHLDKTVETAEGDTPHAHRPHRDWLLELGNILQTTLDVDKLIELFSEQAKSMVSHDSVNFESESKNLALNYGTPQRYSCTYDVFLLEDFLGTMTFTRSERFTEQEIRLVEYMLMGIVHPLNNAYLYSEAIRAASHDPLTGVNNRTSLDRVINREIDLARRHLMPLSIIMIDVDRFQSINHSHGYVVGDNALKSVAGCVTACARESDIVFRYNDDVFVIVLTNTSIDGPSFLAERIRETVEGLDIELAEIQLQITVSVGVTRYDQDNNGVGLLEKADTGLSESKSRGGNCVTYSIP